MENLKISAKMQASINKVEKKYGNLHKFFGVEKEPYNKNFYCYCKLRCDILKSIAITVLHNGEIHNL